MTICFGDPVRQEVWSFTRIASKYLMNSRVAHFKEFYHLK